MGRKRGKCCRNVGQHLGKYGEKKRKKKYGEFVVRGARLKQCRSGAGAGPDSIGDEYSEDASVGKFPTGWWTTFGSGRRRIAFERI